MYIMLSWLIIIGMTVVNFELITNFKATIFMVFGTGLAYYVCYSLSADEIGCITTQCRSRLFRESESGWHDRYYEYLKWFIVGSVFFILAIGITWYLPNDYTINFPGVVGSVCVLVIGIALAHILGTLRGFQKYPA